MDKEYKARKNPVKTSFYTRWISFKMFYDTHANKDKKYIHINKFVSWLIFLAHQLYVSESFIWDN